MLNNEILKYFVFIIEFFIRDRIFSWATLFARNILQFQVCVFLYFLYFIFSNLINIITIVEIFFKYFIHARCIRKKFCEQLYVVDRRFEESFTNDFYFLFLCILFSLIFFRPFGSFVFFSIG